MRILEKLKPYSWDADQVLQRRRLENGLQIIINLIRFNQALTAIYRVTHLYDPNIM